MKGRGGVRKVRRPEPEKWDWNPEEDEGWGGAVSPSKPSAPSPEVSASSSFSSASNPEDDWGSGWASTTRTSSSVTPKATTRVYKKRSTPSVVLESSGDAASWNENADAEGLFSSDAYSYITPSASATASGGNSMDGGVDPASFFESNSAPSLSSPPSFDGGESGKEDLLEDSSGDCMSYSNIALIVVGVVVALALLVFFVPMGEGGAGDVQRAIISQMEEMKMNAFGQERDEEDGPDPYSADEPKSDGYAAKDYDDAESDRNGRHWGGQTRRFSKRDKAETSRNRDHEDWKSEEDRVDENGEDEEEREWHVKNDNIEDRRGNEEQEEEESGSIRRDELVDKGHERSGLSRRERVAARLRERRRGTSADRDASEAEEVVGPSPAAESERESERVDREEADSTRHSSWKITGDEDQEENGKGDEDENNVDGDEGDDDDEEDVRQSDIVRVEEPIGPAPAAGEVERENGENSGERWNEEESSSSSTQSASSSGRRQFSEKKNFDLSNLLSHLKSKRASDGKQKSPSIDGERANAVNDATLRGESEGEENENNAYTSRSYSGEEKNDDQSWREPWTKATADVQAYLTKSSSSDSVESAPEKDRLDDADALSANQGQSSLGFEGSHLSNNPERSSLTQPGANGQWRNDLEVHTAKSGWRDGSQWRDNTRTDEFKNEPRSEDHPPNEGQPPDNGQPLDDEQLLNEGQPLNNGQPLDDEQPLSNVQPLQDQILQEDQTLPKEQSLQESRIFDEQNGHQLSAWDDQERQKQSGVMDVDDHVGQAGQNPERRISQQTSSSQIREGNSVPRGSVGEERQEFANSDLLSHAAAVDKSEGTREESHSGKAAVESVETWRAEDPSSVSSPLLSDSVNSKFSTAATTANHGQYAGGDDQKTFSSLLQESASNSAVFSTSTQGQYPAKSVQENDQIQQAAETGAENARDGQQPEIQPIRSSGGEEASSTGYYPPLQQSLEKPAQQSQDHSSWGWVEDAGGGSKNGGGVQKDAGRKGEVEHKGPSRLGDVYTNQDIRRAFVEESAPVEATGNPFDNSGRSKLLLNFQNSPEKWDVNGEGRSNTGEEENWGQRKPSFDREEAQERLLGLAAKDREREKRVEVNSQEFSPQQF